MRRRRSEATPLPPDACPIPCNLCGGEAIDELSMRDRRGLHLRTTICRRCGLVWSNPRPAEDMVRRYYEREYRREYAGTPTPSLRMVARSGFAALDRCRTLRRHLRPDDRILDVGAGGGELVYMLRRLGFDAHGIEPDESWSAWAREVLDLPVQPGFVQSVSFPPHHFNLVTMYHVLEHLEDPAGALATVREWIVPGGSLLIEVPNVEATCHAPHRRFHFAHFYSFSDVTLAALGEAAGFEPVQTRLAPDGALIECLFRKAETARRVTSIPGSCERTARRIADHRTLAHYLTPTPYARVAKRLQAWVRALRTAAGCTDAGQVLDRIAARATDLRLAA